MSNLFNIFEQASVCFVPTRRENFFIDFKIFLDPVEIQIRDSKTFEAFGCRCTPPEVIGVINLTYNIVTFLSFKKHFVNSSIAKK